MQNRKTNIGRLPLTEITKTKIEFRPWMRIHVYITQRYVITHAYPDINGSWFSLNSKHKSVPTPHRILQVQLPIHARISDFAKKRGSWTSSRSSHWTWRCFLNTTARIPGEWEIDIHGWYSLMEYQVRLGAPTRTTTKFGVTIRPKLTDIILWPRHNTWLAATVLGDIGEKSDRWLFSSGLCF